MEKLYDTYTAILKRGTGAGHGMYRTHCRFMQRQWQEKHGKTAGNNKISASGNIIKNVKSVVVPNTGGLRPGILCGSRRRNRGRKRLRRSLEVLADITKHR